MLGNSQCVTLAAGAALLLAQTALATAHTAHASRGYGHRYALHRQTLAYRYRRPQAIMHDVAGSPVYGPFGGYQDAAAAAQYSGPNARSYFGYGAEQRSAPGVDQRFALEGLVQQQASANGVPASLVDRVIMRESRYNPRAAHAGNYGLMQIKLGTARAMGYGGSAAGLLDAETNMTYAVRYLAGAYQAAGGNENRAIALYASGYNAPRLRRASFTAPAPAGSFSSAADTSAASPPLLADVPPVAEAPRVDAAH